MSDRALKPHGTEAAYRRHHRLGEPPCEECRRGAAKKRAERRGVHKPQGADTPMRELRDVVQSILTTDAGKIDYQAEYQRLYGFLNRALLEAMPREVASLVKEMRGILLDLRTMDVKDDAGNLQAMHEQFAAAVKSLGDVQDDD